MSPSIAPGSSLHLSASSWTFLFFSFVNFPTSTIGLLGSPSQWPTYVIISGPVFWGTQRRSCPLQLCIISKLLTEKKKKKHHLKVENYALLGGFFFFLFFLVGAVSPDDSLLDCSEGFSPRGKGGTSIKKSVYSKSQVVETSKDARNQISPGNEFSTFLWEDVRVWAHENHSLDMHLTHLGAVSCFSPAWVPLGCTAGGSCRDWGFDGCNIFCLLIRQVKFFIHKIYS